MLKSLFSFHTFIKAFDRKLQSDPKPCCVTHQSCSCIPAAFLSLARSLSTDWKSQLTVEIYLSWWAKMTRHSLIIIIIAIIIEAIITIIITPSKARSVNTDWKPRQLTAISDISRMEIALALHHQNLHNHFNNHHNHLHHYSVNHLYRHWYQTVAHYIRSFGEIQLTNCKRRSNMDFVTSAGITFSSSS